MQKAATKRRAIAKTRATSVAKADVPTTTLHRAIYSDTAHAPDAGRPKSKRCCVQLNRTTEQTTAARPAISCAVQVYESHIVQIRASDTDEIKNSTRVYSGEDFLLIISPCYHTNALRNYRGPKGVGHCTETT